MLSSFPPARTTASSNPIPRNASASYSHRSNPSTLLLQPHIPSPIFTTFPNLHFLPQDPKEEKRERGTHGGNKTSLQLLAKNATAAYILTSALAVVSPPPSPISLPPSPHPLPHPFPLIQAPEEQPTHTKDYNTPHHTLILAGRDLPVERVEVV